MLTEMTRSLEAVMLDRILFIGEEVPDALTEDSRSKFILLGNPQEFIDHVVAQLTTEEDGRAD